MEGDSDPTDLLLASIPSTRFLLLDTNVDFHSPVDEVDLQSTLMAVALPNFLLALFQGRAPKKIFDLCLKNMEML
jgi:hypothetical protein